MKKFDTCGRHSYLVLVSFLLNSNFEFVLLVACRVGAVVGRMACVNEHDNREWSGWFSVALQAIYCPKVCFFSETFRSFFADTF